MKKIVCGSAGLLVLLGVVLGIVLLTNGGKVEYSEKQIKEVEDTEHRKNPEDEEIAVVVGENGEVEVDFVAEDTDSEKADKEDRDEVESVKEENSKLTGNITKSSNDKGNSTTKPNEEKPVVTPEVEKPVVTHEEEKEGVVKPTPTPSKPVVTPTPSKPTPTPTPTPSKPVHTHTWVDVTETVYHPAETKTEIRVIEEAWTEDVPIYEKYYVEICNGCGMDITNNRGHLKEQALTGNYACGSSRTEPRKRQVGTDIIEHPAVTEEVTVVINEAWTETIIMGQKCSECNLLK